MNVSAIETSDPALAKLQNLLGADRAKVVIADTLQRIGLVSLRSADDRFRFGTELMKRGGVLEAIGRAIKIQAILHGARE